MVAIAAWPQRGGTDQEWQQVKDFVGAIHGSFSAPPKDLVTVKFTSGALLGNADIGVVVGGRSTSEQTFWVGKSDFWGTHWSARHNAPEVRGEPGTLDLSIQKVCRSCWSS